MILHTTENHWVLGFLCLCILFAGVASYVFVSGMGSRPPGCPPGPPTLPIIGNLHLMPKSKTYPAFQKWAEEYGPIYSLILGSQVVIVLSSDVVIKDLLDRRSAIYSSRPELYISNIAKGGLEWSLEPYGETWRTSRRSAHPMINVKAASAYTPYHDLDNKALLVGLLDNPTDFVAQIQRYTDSVTTQLLFGYRAVTKDAPHLREFYDHIEEFSEIASSTMASLLDLFPTLRWLPDVLLPARTKARAFHKKEKTAVLQSWLQVKQQIQAGTAKPCIAHQMLHVQKTERLRDDQAAYALHVLHEGGADTTACTLRAFVQAMVLYPAVQRRARAELDRVCGGADGLRLPLTTGHDDDYARLPYVRACVKEVLRWFPVLGMGVPHAVLQDDVYRGYRIPRGATVLLNARTVNFDPARYARPRVFDPARFLSGDEDGDEDAAAAAAAGRDHFSFGAGRRICPGMHIAERTLFLSIARLLWGFEFAKATREVPVPVPVSGSDDGGAAAAQEGGAARRVVVEITPDQDDIVEGLISFPAPFPAVIRPRSDQHAAVMRAAWAACQELLDGDRQWKAVPEGMFKYGYTATADLGY